MNVTYLVSTLYFFFMKNNTIVISFTCCFPFEIDLSLVIEKLI